LPLVFSEAKEKKSDLKQSLKNDIETRVNVLKSQLDNARDFLFEKVDQMYQNQFE
jgi:hypothetical protein